MLSDLNKRSIFFKYNLLVYSDGQHDKLFKASLATIVHIYFNVKLSYFFTVVAVIIMIML